jgi:hypothetical protein
MSDLSPQSGPKWTLMSWLSRTATRRMTRLFGEPCGILRREVNPLQSHRHPANDPAHITEGETR